MNDGIGQASNEQQSSYIGELSAKLDLDTYGLSHLRNKYPWDWTDIDVDRLLDAFAKEDIAPTFELPPSLEYIEPLLASSHCRRCGRCCLVNPLNPAHSGVEVFEVELKSISRYLRMPYKSLKKKTLAGQRLNNQLAPNGVAITRRLPLPCMFYDAKKKECKIYEVRPVVCRVYPVGFTESDMSFKIRVNCEYGRDLYKSLIVLLRDKARHLFSGQQ
jgi:Fe-S-cluster containining protein